MKAERITFIAAKPKASFASITAVVLVVALLYFFAAITIIVALYVIAFCILVLAANYVYVRAKQKLARHKPVVRK